MKKLVLLVAMVFAVTNTSFGQSLNHQDLGILLSKDDNNGTARFIGLSGAFGALGGDISVINTNPAGLSVFKNSLFTGTFNARTSDINSNYYGTSTLSQDQYINLSQAGAVLVFDSSFKSDWTKFAIGFNYRITQDFDNGFLTKGNSNITTFSEFPLDNNITPINYNIADEQIFNNIMNGELSELNIAFSSVHQNKIHLGLGFNFYDLNFSQATTLTEFNSDSNGNQLDANLFQERILTGTGFSLNAGFIYKAHKSFRFGVAYQTPTWFSEIIEESNIVNNDGFLGDTEIIVSNDNIIYDNTSGGFFPSQQLLYRLKTPSKLTASAALIFGKNGLLSIDVTSKNYSSIKFSGLDFTNENAFFQNSLKNTYDVRVGTEWRLDRFSIRGGLFKEQSPNISNILQENSIVNSSDINGFSIGGGYNFGSFKLDFAYSDNNRTSSYNFYDGFGVDPANQTIDNKTFTATITLSL